MLQEKRMIVLVESNVLKDEFLVSNPDFLSIREKLKTFREGEDDLNDKVDLIICLGGDGTLLYASSLFQVIHADVFLFSKLGFKV